MRDAIAAHRQRLDANPVEYLHGPGDGLSAAAREAAGRFLGAPASEVALTDSTTMGLGLLYTRLALGADDEVVTTEHDFYATHESLRLSGVRVRRVRLYDDARRASEDEIVSRMQRAVTGRTRLVALTWVHSGTGVRLPVRSIAQALPERVLVCVDGVHGFGARAETVRDLGCDAFVSGCHKWLYGPRGTGVLWANERVRQLMRPTIPSFDGSSYGAWVAGGVPGGVPDGPTLTPGGFQSFEHRWAPARGVRLPPGDRPGARRGSDPWSRVPPEGGSGRGEGRAAADAAVTRAVGRARVLRGRRSRPVRGRRAPRVAGHRRERHAVCRALRAARAGDREHARARRRRGARDRGALVTRPGPHRVRNEPDESVWLPLRSMASTSHLYAVRGCRNPSGTAMLVTVRGT